MDSLLFFYPDGFQGMRVSQCSVSVTKYLRHSTSKEKSSLGSSCRGFGPRSTDFINVGTVTSPRIGAAVCDQGSRTLVAFRNQKREEGEGEVLIAPSRLCPQDLTFSHQALPLKGSTISHERLWLVLKSLAWTFRGHLSKL
jgi:hypothetical protein